MHVKDCMTKNVNLASPSISLKEAAEKMKSGDFGCLPVGEGDRLIGMVTDRDITIRGVAEGWDPGTTPIRAVMTPNLVFCYEDQTIEEVARSMGRSQIRRLPVLNRQKKLVGILSLGDFAIAETESECAAEALGRISQHSHREIHTHA